jgi:hypothetical protein
MNGLGPKDVPREEICDSELDKSAAAGLSYLIEAAMGNNMPIGVRNPPWEYVYVYVVVLGYSKGFGPRFAKGYISIHSSVSTTEYLTPTVKRSGVSMNRFG